MIANTYRNCSELWWTPEPWWEWVAQTLGVPRGEVFDPCPQGWDPSMGSGLEKSWEGPTYVNHPGGRGRTKVWWDKTMEEHRRGVPVVWCAFNNEQLRHLAPTPWFLRGWVVMPMCRIKFLWGGPTIPRAGKGGRERIHGEESKAPGNWTWFWSSVRPAKTPVESVVVETGRCVMLGR